MMTQTERETHCAPHKVGTWFSRWHCRGAVIYHL